MQVGPNHDGTMESGISDYELLKNLIEDHHAMDDDDMMKYIDAMNENIGSDNVDMPIGHDVTTANHHMHPDFPTMDLVSHSGHHHGAGGNSTAFCSGETGMVMIMEGFQWSLKGQSSCINLYFPGWTLNSKGRFIGAMLAVFLLSISTEAISRFRHDLSTKSRSSSKDVQRNIAYMQTGLHGIHALVGYMIMLATMTFSLELLVSVILGLAMGYFLFGGDTYTHVTTNPCCAFLEEEANQRETSAEEQGNDDGTTRLLESANGVEGVSENPQVEP